MEPGWLDVVCSGRKHRWRWVQSWRDIGFQECQLCGMTRSIASRQTVVVGDDELRVVDDPEKMELPMREAEPHELPGAVTTPNPLMLKPPRQHSRPSVAAAAKRAAGVLAELAKGTKPAAVAAMFAISPARVYQIRDKARKQQPAEATA